MRIALPVTAGKMAQHFGHCEQFALIDVDASTSQITEQTFIEAPPHQPGLLPQWLAERAVDVIIAGGMGSRALRLFADHGIQVVTGAPAVVPEMLVKDYLAGRLAVGPNICDH
jgi:predicted Fe-Mo cluster-binding NifX family protein